MNKELSECEDTAGAFLKTENLTRIYRMGTEKIYGVHEVNFHAKRGDFIVINGPSGSGKTTFLNLLAAIDKPTSGEVYIDDQAISGLSEGQLAEIRKEKIGLIFQTFNLIPVLTAFENVEYPLLLIDLDRKERRERVTNILKQVGLEDMINRRPDDLSGGQRQRVAIARALVTDPQLVLADEPTANLDSKTGEQMVKLMRALNQDYCGAYILVTHDPIVTKYARRKVKILDGNLEEVDQDVATDTAS